MIVLGGEVDSIAELGKLVDVVGKLYKAFFQLCPVLNV